jgi:hypothetical protein
MILILVSISETKLQGKILIKSDLDYIKNCFLSIRLKEIQYIDLKMKLILEYLEVFHISLTHHDRFLSVELS